MQVAGYCTHILDDGIWLRENVGVEPLDDELFTVVCIGEERVVNVSAAICLDMFQ